MYASLAGSHTAAGMRAVISGSKRHNKESKLTVDGCLNLECIMKQDPGYANAIKEGILWTVVGQHVIDEVPEVAPLLMEAQNTNVYKKESEYQVLKRTRAMIGSKSQVTWQEVKTQIMKTKPECVESCPYMFQYLKERCPFG